MAFSMATLKLTIPFPCSNNVYTNQYINISCNCQFDDATPSLNGQPAQKLNWSSQVNTLKSVGRKGLLKTADTNTYVSLLQSCTDVKQLKQRHARMFTSGFDQNKYILSKLVSMYAVCGGMENARLLFDKIPKRSLFLCNTMIRGYATNGLWEEALALYYQMQRAAIQPNNFTFPFVLEACASLSALEEGEGIHDHIVRTGFESGIFAGNSLVAMYAKCEHVTAARQLFDNIYEGDIVSWNTMIAGYAENGYDDEALTLFNQMLLAGVVPDSMTVASVIQACAHLGDLQRGKWIHDYIIQRGFESDLFVGNSLIDV